VGGLINLASFVPTSSRWMNILALGLRPNCRVAVVERRFVLCESRKRPFALPPALEGGPQERLFLSSIWQRHITVAGPWFHSPRRPAFPTHP